MSWIDTKAREQRRKKVRDGNFIADDFQAGRIGLSNDLSTANPATTDHDGGHLGKVVASLVGINLWRPTEFAHPHNDRFVPQAACLEVVDQCAPGTIDFATEASDAGEVLVLRISAFHETDARFKKSTGEQAALSER